MLLSNMEQVPGHRIVTTVVILGITGLLRF